MICYVAKCALVIAHSTHISGLQVPALILKAECPNQQSTCRSKWSAHSKVCLVGTFYLLVRSFDFFLQAVACSYTIAKCV